jgi:hypothetical protein
MLFLVFVIAGLSASAIVSWKIRDAEIPGVYRASGSWGSSELTLRSDHSFGQVALLRDYHGNPLPGEAVEGTWEEESRGWLSKDLVFRPCLHLKTFHGGRACGEQHTFIGQIMFSGVGIEGDSGAGIAFWK